MFIVSAPEKKITLGPNGGSCSAPIPIGTAGIIVNADAIAPQFLPLFRDLPQKGIAALPALSENARIKIQSQHVLGSFVEREAEIFQRLAAAEVIQLDGASLTSDGLEQCQGQSAFTTEKRVDKILPKLLWNHLV